MADIRSIEPAKYNASLATALKKLEEFKRPEWVDFVKSGQNKQRPINDPDFWYRRGASILRQVYIQGIVGVQRLRTRYGGRKDRGMKPPQFRKAGGKILRTFLQQAELAGLIEKSKSKRAGRQLTKKGKEFLEEIRA